MQFLPTSSHPPHPTLHIAATHLLNTDASTISTYVGWGRQSAPLLLPTLSAVWDKVRKADAKASPVRTAAITASESRTPRISSSRMAPRSRSRGPGSALGEGKGGGGSLQWKGGSGGGQFAMERGEWENRYQPGSNTRGGAGHAECIQYPAGQPHSLAPMPPLTPPSISHPTRCQPCSQIMSGPLVHRRRPDQQAGHWQAQVDSDGTCVAAR